MYVYSTQKLYISFDSFVPISVIWSTLTSPRADSAEQAEEQAVCCSRASARTQGLRAAARAAAGCPQVQAGRSGALAT